MEARMQKFLEKFQHLKIQLEEIKQVTNNFNDNRIGVGGFGKVYKGELSHSRGRGMVAIKRLDPTSRQGVPEFLKEITMLSEYKHGNLISLLGFCFEGSEMILVYEHASNGSLDRYLNSPHLTWSQRIKICLDAAKGLNYLHDPRETHRRVIHCDVKSGNILLDEQWNAKVSDLGLSTIGPANDQYSLTVTLAAGTEGYIDPQYWMTHILTKESDVYSFGVVLFEILCGRLCYTLDSNGHVEKILVPTWKECYEQKKLNDIIFKNSAIQPMDQTSIETFSDIAYRCLQESSKDRPKMAQVVTELETALESPELMESQEFNVWKTQDCCYDDMLKTAEHPPNYRSTVELWKLLSKGVLLNGGKTWFSLNKKGEHCEMIPFAECLDSELGSNSRSSKYNSRFAVGTYYSKNWRFETRVKTHFLSPGIAYMVNLVVKYSGALTYLKYKLQGEKESSIAYLGYWREDGLWVAELYQFTSDNKSVDLQIMFDGLSPYNYSDIEAEGIEFVPLEKVEPISASYANWEKSKNGHIDNNGKRCYIQSARTAIHAWPVVYLPLPESRFGEALIWQDHLGYFYVNTNIGHLSRETTYATYLVYRLPEDQSKPNAPIEVKEDKNYIRSRDSIWHIYLSPPRTSSNRPTADQNTSNPLDRPKIEGVPQQRNDGWLEVEIWTFQACTSSGIIDSVHLALSSSGLVGVIVQGIEFRPI